MKRDHTRGVVVRDHAGKFTKRTTPPKKIATPAAPSSRLTITENAGVVTRRFTTTIKE